MPSPQSIFVVADTLGTKAGSYLSTLLLCQALVRLRFRVTCFAQSVALADPNEMEFSIKTPCVKRGWRWDWPGKSLVWRVILQSRHEKPPIIFVMGVTRLTRYLLRSSIAGNILVWENTNANPRNKFVDAEASRILGRARALLSPSKTIDQGIRSTYQYRGPVLRLSFWIHNLKRNYEPPPQNFRFDFIFLGRIDEQKGLNELIQATAVVARRYPGVRVLIAGQGRIEPFSKLAQGLGLDSNVEFRFFDEHQQKDKERALAASRCLILPSYHEGYPLVLLESAQWSIPFIATRVGSVPDLFSGSPGCLLVARQDFQGLAQAMGTMMTEPEELYVKRRQAAWSSFQRLAVETEPMGALRRLFDELKRLPPDLNLNCF